MFGEFNVIDMIKTVGDLKKLFEQLPDDFMIKCR